LQDIKKFAGRFGNCAGTTRAYLAVMPERTQKPTSPAPWERKQGDGDGPKAPDVKKPDTKSILDRMRKVDPDQARRYRQRTGQ
jgi:hypothetical protein